MSSATNRWVFREGRSSARGEAVRAGLVESLAKLRVPTRDRIVDALLRAGEMETALADAETEEARVAADITQSVAGALVGCPATNLDARAVVAEQMRVPESVEISVAEGFAYYALHPLAYAELMDRIPTLARAAKVPRAAVIGIRSIGATLSAVVTAALARNNVRADRITVRPVGHPYDRKTQFRAAQLRWIAAARHEQAEFLVVDEGPGLSGSSFLSVGEALLSAGVERRRIRFLCSWEADPNALTAPDAGERWRGFQSSAARGHRPEGKGLIDVSAGQWRSVFPKNRPWDSDEMCGAPEVASWIQMERTKFLSGDGRRLFKFAGLGRFGEEIARRAEVLAASGFGPKCFAVDDGYAEYEMLGGRPARREDLSRGLIERMADYCAMRATEFRVRGARESSLDAMARYNYEQEFGTAAPWLPLEQTEATVICDGRMQPHEWILGDGIARKTDGEAHGDDHFLPGPTDIAWDLAGAIVEWDMERDAAEMFLRRYATRSGDDAGARVEPYVLAYAACRTAFCRMGAAASAGSAEQGRLAAAADRYRDFIVSHSTETVITPD